MNYDKYKRVATALLSHDFKFARTMFSSPHFYTLREGWDDKLFTEVINYIYENGYSEIFGSKKYQMFNLNGFKYWVVDTPSEKTILINKTVTSYKANYDLISDKYDELFNDEEYVNEDLRLIEYLDIKGKVLDIGCGSGLLLKYANIFPPNYVGIDPSLNMLVRLCNKYPQYSKSVINSTFEDYFGEGFDTIVALYGAASYLDQDSLDKIPNMLSKSGIAYLMYYADGYYPETYKKTNVFFNYTSSKDGLRFGNYFIHIINENLSK